MSAPTTTATYRVAKLQQHETHNGVAFVADILRDGTKVGSVEQEGRGGCNLYFFTDPAERAAFRAAAEAKYGADEFEVADKFTEHLITVLEFGRMRRVPFVFEGDNVEFGEYRQGPAGMTFEQLVEALRTRYAAKNPRVWSKTVGDWVSVA